MDVGGLYDCLLGIYEGKADHSILDKYSDIRRQKYLEIVDPISSENIRRLFGQDPDKALETDEFLKLCKRAEKDVEFSREFQRVSKTISFAWSFFAYLFVQGVNNLKHDFTREYKGVNGASV